MPDLSAYATGFPGSPTYWKTTSDPGANTPAAALRSIDTGRVLPGSYLLVENMDRLSRMPILDALDLFRSILNRRINIVILSKQKIYTKESINDLGEIIEPLVDMSRSHGESVRKQDMLSKAWANKRQRAITDNHKITSICPLWLELKDQQFIVRPDRVQLVQRMYQMCLDGHGPLSIAKQLNREGIPTWNARTEGWHRAYVRAILLNPAVYGVFIPGRRVTKTKRVTLEPIPDYYPVIVSKDIYMQAQHAIAKRTGKGGRPGNHVNIFSALLRCAMCHGPIVRLNKSKKARINVLYACDNGRQGLSDCKYLPWPVSEVEELILEELTELDVSALFADQETQLQAIRTSIAATRAAITLMQSDLTKLEDYAIKNELSKGLVKRMLAMESEVARHEAKLAGLEEDERRELLQQNKAVVAVEQIQSLRTADPSMRVKLQSHIRDLVQVFVVSLPQRRIVAHGDGWRRTIRGAGEFVAHPHLVFIDLPT